MVELSKSASGEEGCTIASDDEIEVLFNSLRSEVSTLRYVAIQCLQALSMVLPSIDRDTDAQSDVVYPVVLRVWVAKCDVDEEMSKLAERYMFHKRVAKATSCSIIHHTPIIHYTPSRVPWSCIFRNWSRLGLKMYIFLTLEFTLLLIISSE